MFKSKKLIPAWRCSIKRILMVATLFTLHSSLFTLHSQTLTHMLGLGPSALLDTYISQEKYAGRGITYLYIRDFQKPDKRWSTLIEHELDFSSTKDRSGKCSMLEGDYNLYWGRYHRWQITDGLRLHGGGLVNANIGFLYDMTNSNNPAQARFSLNIMPAGFATYDFSLWRQSFSLRYELALPLAGLMFSPNYGQSYYEIFSRGEYDHNIVPTTFVSAPTLRHLFSLEWRTGKRWNLRLAYLGNYQQAAVNNLKQHIYTHRILFGISRSL